MCKVGIKTILQSGSEMFGVDGTTHLLSSVIGHHHSKSVAQNGLLGLYASFFLFQVQLL